MITKNRAATFCRNVTFPFIFVLSLVCCLSLGAQEQGPAKGGDSTIVEAKLKQIILPAVKCENVSLREAIDLIHAASIQNDATPDEKSKGVNLVLKTSDRIRGVAITLDLKSVSLKDALNAVAWQARLKVFVSPYAVTLVPED
jgi:hypothetical protein